MGLRPVEILLILGVLLLLFGATRLPALGSSLGSAIKNFKRGFGGDDPPDATKKPENLSASASGEVKDAAPKVTSRD